MHNGMKTLEELFYKVLDTAKVASLSEKDRMRY